LISNKIFVQFWRLLTLSSQVAGSLIKDAL
jgi:hypothetical protein